MGSGRKQGDRETPDAVSASCTSHWIVRSVFSLDPSKFLCTHLVVPSAAVNRPASSVCPILPACFKLPIISFILCLMELPAWFFSISKFFLSSEVIIQYLYGPL